MITIYHKAGCSTSNKVLAMLKESGKKFKVVEYIKTPLSGDELKNLLIKLSNPAEELIRKKEAEFKPRFLIRNLLNTDTVSVIVQ
jgi:arsenate reductase